MKPRVEYASLSRIHLSSVPTSDATLKGETIVSGMETCAGNNESV